MTRMVTALRIVKENINGIKNPSLLYRDGFFVVAIFLFGCCQSYNYSDRIQNYY